MMQASGNTIMSSCHTVIHVLYSGYYYGVIRNELSRKYSIYFIWKEMCRLDFPVDSIVLGTSVQLCPAQSTLLM